MVGVETGSWDAGCDTQRLPRPGAGAGAAGDEGLQLIARHEDLTADEDARAQRDVPLRGGVVSLEDAEDGRDHEGRQRGVAPDDGLSSDDLLIKADNALYRSKTSGRGCFHFFRKAA